METLPRFVLGGATLPSLRRRFRFEPYARAYELLDVALEAGCTAVDTAAVYGGGVSEVVIGRWLRSRRAHGRMRIVGKGGHPEADGHSRVDPAHVEADLHGSLRRLRVDCIDYYLLHRDDPRIPVGSIIDALHRFVQAGKVRHVGVSNWSYERIEAANQYALSRGLTPISVSSPHFSLTEMHAPPWPGCISITGDANAEARAFYAATRMPVLAWSPLSGGFLAGRDPTDDAQRRAYVSPANRERRARAELLAKQRGVSLAQIGLAYLLAQPMDVRPILGTSSPANLRTLLDATRISLSTNDVRWLEHGDLPATKSPRTESACIRSFGGSLSPGT